MRKPYYFPFYTTKCSPATLFFDRKIRYVLPFIPTSKKQSKASIDTAKRRRENNWKKTVDNTQTRKSPSRLSVGERIVSQDPHTKRFSNKGYVDALGPHSKQYWLILDSSKRELRNVKDIKRILQSPPRDKSETTLSPQSHNIPTTDHTVPRRSSRLQDKRTKLNTWVMGGKCTKEACEKHCKASTSSTVIENGNGQEEINQYSVIAMQNQHLISATSMSGIALIIIVLIGMLLCCRHFSFRIPFIRKSATHPRGTHTDLTETGLARSIHP